VTLALPNADAITEPADVTIGIALIDTQSEIPYTPAPKKEVHYVKVGQLGIIA